MTKHPVASAAAVGIIAVLALAACSGGNDPSNGASNGPSDGASDGIGPTGGDEEYVSGGTFRVAVVSDPGSLVPMTAVQPATWATITYAYESLISIGPDGEIEPWLAEAWDESSTEVVFTLRDDITCADGTSFTAQTAAENISYHADPDNGSFYYGSLVTEAVSATGEGQSLTVTSETNDPFLLVNVGQILMVCQSGLDDPDSLAEATAGTGLWVLDEVQPQTSYTFVKREGYTWGPGGVTSETEGLPDAVEVQVIADGGTTANLLLSGDLNAAAIATADRARLESAGLDHAVRVNPIGEILFNEREDRVTSDPLVREALMIALDREEVGEVVTDGMSVPVTSLVNQPPLTCVEAEPAWTLPETDLERAGDLLDEAGWTLGDDGLRSRDGEPLAVKFIYDGGTASHAASAELVAQTWDALGVTTDLSGNDATAWSEQLYQTFDWDLGWVQIAPGDPVVLSLFFGATPEEGGLNFMFVDNPDYDAFAEQARQASSQEEACDLWNQAETALIERFDVFPLAYAGMPTYMSGAVFEQSSNIIPTSIRMLG